LAGVACHKCKYQSDLIILITATLEKAIDLFDCLLKHYKSKITELEWQCLNLFFREEDCSSPSGDTMRLCTSTVDMLQHDIELEVLEKISFGEYCVDQREEQLLLVSVLVKC